MDRQQWELDKKELAANTRSMGKSQKYAQQKKWDRVQKPYF